ncbi:heavy metal translocating P-type ATPase, partial [Candidatus Roizmanbacteria bacterium]|nr:heavy metal translocating P-type ATPase [Candidatus Roizmanbacteria bacterium]
MNNNVFTCPMHPEVQKDKPGTCPKCGMKLVQKKGSEVNTTEHEHDEFAMMHGGTEVAQSFLRRFLIVTVLLVPLALLSEMGVEYFKVPDFSLRPYLEFAIATIIFYFSLIFFQHAQHEIAARKYGMMTLVSLAVGSGYLFSAVGTFVPSLEAEFYLEISTLIWVLLFGHYLEAKSASAAGDALSEVAKLLPKQAHLLVNGTVKEVTVETLKKGDMVRILPGEKAPADGVIMKGSANFNEAHISGESKPLHKSEEDHVVAGAICIDGSVEVRLDRVGEHSTIGQIQKLISEARQTKPNVQRIADRAAGWLTITALSVALLTLLVWSLIVGQTFVFALTLAITVLVIACPHALGLAIPTVTTIATQLAVKNGIFIKDMGKLEAVKDIGYVVFDKTGTLTKGTFGVTDVTGGEDLLAIAASLEAHSSHVIGISIVKHAKEQKIALKTAENIKNIAGKGLEGTIQKTRYMIGNTTLMEEKNLVTNEAKKTYAKLAEEGKTVVFVSDTKKILGLIALSDEIKQESYQTVEALHRLNVKVAMLTGDNRGVANGVAKKLAIDTVFAEVLPEKKYEHIKQLQKEGTKV